MPGYRSTQTDANGEYALTLLPGVYARPKKLGQLLADLGTGHRTTRPPRRSYSRTRVGDG